MNLLQIEIPNFAREVTVSEKQRAKYYELNKWKNDDGTFKLPKKYMNSNYGWTMIGKKTVLYDNVNQEPVVRNSKTAGTPRKMEIKGNSIWDGTLQEVHLNKFKISIAEYFWNVLSHYMNTSMIEEISIKLETHYPLRVVFEFHTYKEEQDIDNLDVFYRKAFLDGVQDKYSYEKGQKKELVQRRLLRNDDKSVIRSLHTEHYDCLQGEDKLIISIHNCEDKREVDYDKPLQLNLSEILKQENK